MVLVKTVSVPHFVTLNATIYYLFIFLEGTLFFFLAQIFIDCYCATVQYFLVCRVLVSKKSAMVLVFSCDFLSLGFEFLFLLRLLLVLFLFFPTLNFKSILLFISCVVSSLSKVLLGFPSCLSCLLWLSALLRLVSPVSCQPFSVPIVSPAPSSP